MLGSYPNSNRRVEIEMMSIIAEETELITETTKAIYTMSEEEKMVLSKLRACQNIDMKIDSSRFIATPNGDENNEDSVSQFLQRGQVRTGTEWFPGAFIGSDTNALLDDKIVNLLIEYYTYTYPSNTFRPMLKLSGCRRDDIIVSPLGKTYRTLRLGEDVYGCSAAANNCYTMALLGSHDTVPKPARILSFLQHTINISGKISTHSLVLLEFFKEHNAREHFLADGNKPPFLNFTELWKRETYAARFVPVHNITGRFITGKYGLKTSLSGREDCLLVIPFTPKMFI
jgi:hypothetical protein